MRAASSLRISGSIHVYSVKDILDKIKTIGRGHSCRWLVSNFETLAKPRTQLSRWEISSIDPCMLFLKPKVGEKWVSGEVNK